MRSSVLSLLALACAASPLFACGGTVNPSPDGGAPDAATDGQALPPDGGTIPVLPVNKLDVLFMIDNSASMGDKQDLLRRAVPDLLARLVTPNCVDASGKILGVSQGGQCAAGALEFKPVSDLHIGVVSSSLGGRGSDVCPGDARNPANPTLNAHNDDNGHLINRGGADEHVVADASPASFLAWFPQGQPAPPVPAIVDSAKLLADFQDVVSGVHEYGCGFEAQLESWYRFLIQPDPYAQLTRDPANTNRIQATGIDATILKQRADFLRPDSAVAIIVLTDENDSTVDPLTMGGQGWAFENSSFPGSPTGAAPKATAACATNLTDSACTSCALKPSDPGCQPAYYDPADDALNERFFHMKQRFGIDPQFPIARYVRALTSTKVPSRDGEHLAGASAYTGEQNATCTNPLFAATLPSSPSDELCTRPTGSRTPDKVFFLVIGGVPHQLLQSNPADPSSPQKPALNDADWTKILGKDPLAYDFTGADPHMLESLTPRPGLPPPGATDNADAIHGREWDTQKRDLQYACTFPLTTPKDCTLPQFAAACDCENGSTAPLCDATNKNLQVRGKAYPTIRELAVARALGGQSIVSSICPIHVTEQSAGDPLFGYRPAMGALVDRLKNVLAR